MPGEYSAVPPPDTLNRVEKPVDIKDAVAKAKLLAEKMKLKRLEQDQTESTSSNSNGGNKRKLDEDEGSEEAREERERDSADYYERTKRSKTSQEEYRTDSEQRDEQREEDRNEKRRREGGRGEVKLIVLVAEDRLAELVGGEGEESKGEKVEELEKRFLVEIVEQVQSK
ncbi:hypothetical protein AX774_g2312 [Zancudomyces culisetae]|uniref:Uncharacterized protein n=1 Tax=Zancudomyces culisetae TaxID=1213189 RepID=A0A1R1PTB6_ZANCU|nr:hypothetical protein AX774_g2312 [Zancudomyces culisetae]|eukprot:OMH84169.1 hypothetical protein AX774_g2312 [Zancudomyces culisetae]